MFGYTFVKGIYGFIWIYERYDNDAVILYFIFF